MRHPRHFEVWLWVSLIHIWFASDLQNVRLALPIDVMGSNYSVWLVILISYNTPPWMCMKQTSFIISMIIPAKRMSGNDIGVYLQQLES